MKNNMFNITLIVEGMKCLHCSKRIENVLKEIDWVKTVSINLKTKEVYVVVKDNIDVNILKNKIEELDFKVIDIK